VESVPAVRQLHREIQLSTGMLPGSTEAAGYFGHHPSQFGGIRGRAILEQFPIFRDPFTLERSKQLPPDGDFLP
jgi:hypothetical protein